MLNANLLLIPRVVFCGHNQPYQHAPTNAHPKLMVKSGKRSARHSSGLAAEGGW